jgi:hypothetical protein
MKKLKAFLMLAAICLCLPVSAWSASVQEGVAVDAVRAVLASDLGDKMIAMAEKLGGGIEDIADGKTIILPGAAAYLIPAGQHNGNKLNLLCIDIKDKGQFIVVTESTGIFNALKIHTASGKIITCKNFKVTVEAAGSAIQQYDDVNNSISIMADATYCLILLIAGLVIFWPALIVWAVQCL